MRLKNRIFHRTLACLVVSGLAMPSFANNAELYNLMVNKDYAGAERLALAMSARGEAYGTCMLGDLSDRALISKRDPATIRKLMSSCVGVADGAAISYTRFLIQGIGGPKDSASAGKILEEALPRDKTGRASIEYAMWLSESWDGAPRPANRRELIKQHAERAASLGQQSAFVRVGLMHNYGSTDMTQGAQSAALRQEALGWFRRSGAEQNDRDGMTHYLKLTGLDQKLGSRELIQLVEVVGAQAAAGELAYYYYTGNKLPQNLPEARYWAENGAKNNNMWATYVFGMMTRDGQGGLSANPQKAVELLTRAHEQRADIAAADLAGMYATGKLIPQDLGKARQWLQTGYDVSREPYKAMYAVGADSKLTRRAD